MLEAFIVIQNWRTCHGLPLNVFQAGLRARAKRVAPDVIVAQRLKRFPSVMNKLVRESSMKLSQMHDLGGCRAILSGVTAVDALYGMYRGNEPLRNGESAMKCYDYIRDPKLDGYRGIHIVGRYSARAKSREAWNGQRIEIQLRSELQHAFATAVETVTTFTREPLKFGAGPPEWRRFFSLMGSALAYREGTPPVKGTPKKEKDLIYELQEATNNLRVREKPRAWTDALRILPRRNMTGFKCLLLVLNLKAITIKVTGYANRAGASQALEKLELSKSGDVDAVIVGLESAGDLRDAYPNYYADTREFIKALDFALTNIETR